MFNPQKKQIPMDSDKKQKVVWWLEFARVIIATIAGLLGGAAL